MLEYDIEAQYEHETGATKKKFKLKDLREIHPKTDKQQDLFDSYDDGFNTIAYGSAGTGKTFLSMYLALQDVLDEETNYERVVIVRSAVPLRDIGFLKGTQEEKTEPYEAPYQGICNELFPFSKTYENLKKSGYIEFRDTSTIIGITIDNAIIIVDEVQNLGFQEIDAIISRVGYNTKIMFCGDTKQTSQVKDLRSGFEDFLRVSSKMRSFRGIEFQPEDIVRSGLVKEWILTKESIGY